MKRSLPRHQAQRGDKTVAGAKGAHHQIQRLGHLLLKLVETAPALMEYIEQRTAAQQKAAGAALSAKRGDTPESKLKGASKSMEKSMSEKELEKMASTSRKGKPERASKKK